MKTLLAMYMAIAFVSPGLAVVANYDDITTNGWYWLGGDDRWDLTECDLTISYTLDMSSYTPPMWNTAWSSIGVADTGGTLGWMSSGAPAAEQTNPNSQDLDDKLNLGAAPTRWDESTYDATGPETLVTPPIGNPWSNYGVWFDRDGVDPYQAMMWGMTDGVTYNTGGTYEVVVTFHGIDTTTGTMFATVNGEKTGFYDSWKNAPPDYYPVGKSISGDITKLRIFASVSGAGVEVVDITVTGCLADTQGPITSNVVADPNPVIAGDSVTVTANVDDSTTGGSDISSAEYTLDGSSGAMSAADGAFDETSEDVTATCTAPTIPGVYDLCVLGTDAAGNEGDPECIMLVAYDPSAGFVTGGGWIDSPAGAYADDPALEGKANFGFVSKYKKGATVPEGNTEFQFKAGDLNFHSSSYEWLVVTGSDYARFKGAGTINGLGNYKFMLWAGDKEPDTFRIRIWEEDELGAETVVYDNGFDQAIAGGSIVIHAK